MAGLTGTLRRPGWPGVLTASALVLAMMLTAGVAAPRAEAAPTAAGPPCGKAVGPFSVRGTQVLGRSGQVFVSYGITVPGLQAANWETSVTLDREKIAATADHWCANTVRLQLDQDNLLGPHGTSFDWAPMASRRWWTASGRTASLRRP
jgi:hypothetical protein